MIPRKCLLVHGPPTKSLRQSTLSLARTEDQGFYRGFKKSLV